MSVDLERHGDHPIGSLPELWTSFETAAKPRAEHRVGLEHEKLLYRSAAPAPVPYEGADGIGALFKQLQAQGLEPLVDVPDHPPIAMVWGAATLSLEPGGQLELSGTPSRTARDAHQENLRHLQQLKGLLPALGIRMVALGYRAFVDRDRMPWMPKARYEAMRKTLPERGDRALDMMLMTATGQVSFDWADEDDCARKVQTAARLTPVLVAMYANSPLIRNEPSGWCSFRSHVWSGMDSSRCGYLPSMVDGTFSYRSYVEWALDAPLLFLRRQGRYATPALTFRQLLAKGYEGSPATFGDWNDHLSTLFPEVRIKRVLEVRGADCVNAELTGALAALWRGVFYDAQALDEASRVVPQLSFQEHLAFHVTAQKQGLAGKLGSRTLAEMARELVTIAQKGLERLDPLDVPVLAPLVELVERGASPAERVLEQWRAHQDPNALLDAFSL